MYLHYNYNYVKSILRKIQKMLTLIVAILNVWDFNDFKIYFHTFCSKIFFKLLGKSLGNSDFIFWPFRRIRGGKRNLYLQTFGYMRAESSNYFSTSIQKDNLTPCWPPLIWSALWNHADLVRDQMAHPKPASLLRGAAEGVKGRAGHDPWAFSKQGKGRRPGRALGSNGKENKL